MSNVKFFENNVDFYSTEYKDYELRPWELKIANTVTGPDVLDVACGGGRMTVPLLRRGHNVTGTDFVAEFVPRITAHADEFKGRFAFTEADMTELPFPDASFDSVTCINSIIYLRNSKELYLAIGEMGRILKPGGKLFITTWNILHPYWITSVILNYLLGRGKFGEVSPFRTTDPRIKNSQTRMFVPTRRALEKVLRSAEIHGCVLTGPEFIGDRNPIMVLHPNIIMVGVKR